MGSVSVRVTEGNTLVLKWSFFDTGPYTSLTYADLLKKLIEGNDICKGTHLQFATASSTFNCVEEIHGGPTVNFLIDIIKSFAMRFFTLHVAQHEGECECQKQTEEPAVRNVFDVMMESARRAASDGVPVPLSETTNWEKLYNVVLQYCLDSGSTFPSNTGSVG